MVDVAEDRAGGCGERVRPPPPEILGPHDAAVDICHARPDKAFRLEPAAALGYLDRAKFARPLVDVLEQVAVNGAQMGKVEVAARNGFEKPLGDELPFRCLQRAGIPDVQLVAENCECRRIAVFGVAHSAATMRRRFSICCSMWARRSSGGHSSRSNISNMASSSGESGLPSIACKWAASASRPSAAARGEPGPLRVTVMVRPYRRSFLCATGLCPIGECNRWAP